MNYNFSIFNLFKVNLYIKIKKLMKMINVYNFI